MAERTTGSGRPAGPAPLDREDVLAVVERLGGVAGVLSVAEPTERARLYEALGVTGTY